MSNKLTNAWPFIVAIVFLISCFLTFKIVPTTFSVNAVTERLEITTSDVPNSRWIFSKAKLRQEENEDPRIVTGALSLESGVSIIMERISFGSLKIQIQNIKGEESIGKFYGENDEFQENFGKLVVFVIDDILQKAKNGESFVFPIKGSIQIGREPRFETRLSVPILRSGKVSMVGRTLLGGKSYMSDSIALQVGDRFVVEQPHGESSGFVVLNERPGINAIFRTVGKKGSILRFGAKGYEIHTSLLDRLFNDSVLQGLWATFAFVLGYVSLLRNKNEGQKKYEKSG